MSLQSRRVSEDQIIIMFQEKNPLVWEKVYEKYATAIYSLIFNLTQDKLLAEEIFLIAFVELKQKQILLKNKCALCLTIMRHTYSYTINHLKEIGILPKNLNSLGESKLIYLLITQCNSLKEVTSILNITVKEAQEKIQGEFEKLRISKNNSIS